MPGNRVGRGQFSKVKLRIGQSIGHVSLELELEACNLCALEM